jgi:hypothetical protein
MIEQYEWMFGFKPSKYTSSLGKSDHPEIDTSAEELFADNMKIYQSMIGSIQWAVSLSRSDHVSIPQCT